MRQMNGRKKKHNLIHACAGLIEAFILFRQRNSKFRNNWQDEEIQVLGAQLVKNLNRIGAWGSELKK